MIKFIFFILLISTFSSCRYYTNNLPFKTKIEYKVDSIDAKINAVQGNYLIRKDDYITFKLFTNQGEVIVDPTGSIKAGKSNIVEEKYIVRNDGTVSLPMVGKLKIIGLSMVRLDSLLSQEFGKFYQDVFVITKVTNKRVFLMGAMGNRTIQLENENMNLIEILAAGVAGGGGGGANLSSARYYNIRIIRGDLKNPSVTIVDITSIESMKKSNLNIQPNDIIYIEPKRKIFIEGLGDFTSVFGLITTIATVYLLFSSFKR